MKLKRDTQKHGKPTRLNTIRIGIPPHNTECTRDKKRGEEDFHFCLLIDLTISKRPKTYSHKTSNQPEKILLPPKANLSHINQIFLLFTQSSHRPQGAGASSSLEILFAGVVVGDGRRRFILCIFCLVSAKIRPHFRSRASEQNSTRRAGKDTA